MGLLIKKPSLLISTSLICLLSACGGGSSNNGSTPSSTGGTQTGTNTPPVVQPVITPANLQSAIPSAYPVGSNEYFAFLAINELRSSMGLGPLNQNPNIDIATKNHADYINVSAMNGDNFHTEVVGRLAFTGITYLDRMIAAGYQAVGGTETGSPTVGAFAITILADTVLHRQAMMMEKLTDVGMVSTVANGTITDYGFKAGQRNASNFVGIYPVNGQTGIAHTHYLESPNPFQDLQMTLANMCAFTGYPISLQSQVSTQLAVTSFTVTENGQGVDIPSRLLVQNTTNPMISPNTAFLVSRTPFKPNTVYNVRFIGTATGNAAEGVMKIEKSWSFTTASKNIINCP